MKGTIVADDDWWAQQIKMSSSSDSESISKSTSTKSDYGVDDVHTEGNKKRKTMHLQAAAVVALVVVIVPKVDQITRIGRHGYATQNVMVVYDFDMMFTFVVAGWPEVARDSCIFNNTLSKYSDYSPHPLKENIILSMQVP